MIDRKRIELSDSEINHSMDTSLYTENVLNQSRKNDATEEKNAKAFLSFFMNKIIFFFNKLTNLKSDLINADPPEKEKFFTRRKKRHSIDSQSSKLSNLTLNDANYVVNPKLVAKEKKIEQLQIKINKLTGGKEFKLFFGFINNENSRSIISFFKLT